MEKRILEKGDVVQLSPTIKSNPMFGACFMVVTEPKEWGAQGYVPALGENGEIGGQAYFRVNWEDMEYVGKATWIAE